MEEVTILGYVLIALITIVGFIISIIKLTKPINDLQLAVQELRGLIKSLGETETTQNSRLDAHGQDIDELRLKVGKLETKVNMYHGN
jgi:hypothetical protein